MLRTAGKGARIAAKKAPKAIKGAEKAGKKVAKEITEKTSSKVIKRAEPVVKKAAKKADVAKDETKKLKDKAVKKLKNLGAKLEDSTKTAKKTSSTKKMLVDKVGSGLVKKTYSNSRPSYGKNQVEQVWKNAKDSVTGKVYDPSGVEITWDKSLPRNGQWDMGHIPGAKYSETHKLYMDDVITKEEFVNWYRDPHNYRPELPSTNRSHVYERR